MADDNFQVLTRRFEHFAATDGRDDALYAALARAIAAEPSLAALLLEAAPNQRLPVLLLAALHDRLLSCGAAEPLAAYCASLGGTRTPDEDLPQLLRDFMRRHDTGLRELLRTRTTQTNEIGRCAVLRPALNWLAQRVRGDGEQAPVRFALFDFGCSAGLNLGVADYAYDDGLRRMPGAVADAPCVRSEWRGTPPLAVSAGRIWTVAQRLGVDLAPIDPADEDATRWLRACVWPGDIERAQRLQQALALARRDPPTLLRSDDGLGALEPWLDGLPPGVTPVLFNVWVLAYFDPPAWRTHLDRVQALVRDRGLAWISGEMGRLSPLSSLPPAPAGLSPPHTTLWTLQWRAPEGLRTDALAWSHPHGRWIEWLAS